MAYPTRYELDYDFTAFQTSNPSTPLPADKIEIEFNNLQLTTDQIINSLMLIQRSDGALKNDSVGNDQLKSEVTIGVNAATDWTTGIDYEANDTVYQSYNVYRCLTDHTAGVFATDLAAGKWTLVLDFNQFLSVSEGDAAAVESDLSAVESDRTAVESTVTAIESDLSAVESDLSAVESDLGAVETDLDAVESDRTAIENSIGTTIQGYDVDLAAIAGITVAQGDLLIGNNAGTPTWSKLAIGAANKYLLSNGTTASWGTPTPPTVQRFTSGSGTCTISAGVTWIRVRLWGAGGGGGGSGTASQTAGSAGGATTFGSSLLTANGGAGGGIIGNAGGLGGTVTVNSPAITVIKLVGGVGGGHGFNNSVANGSSLPGGMGANGPFGGGGGGAVYAGAGIDAEVNTGGGAGGGGTTTGTTNSYSGSGGGGGGFIEAIIVTPDATYSYAVGAAGAKGNAGTNGFAGGIGGSGYIEVTEYYN
jgi:hypothetical protein